MENSGNNVDNMSMERVYVCSQYGTRGNILTNLEFAKVFTMEVIEEGKVPICPHLFLAEVLNDKVESQRAAGMRIGMELLKGCTELRVCSQLSEGMKREILAAVEWGIPVRIANMRYAYSEDKALEIEREIQRELVEVLRNGQEYHTEAHR